MKTTDLRGVRAALCAASAMTLLACGQASTSIGQEPGNAEQAAAPAQPEEDIVFAGTCDGSAAVRLDGQIVVANDEDSKLRVYDLQAGQAIARGELDLRGPLELTTETGEADIEGAATVGDRTYWITSHGLDSEKVRQDDRYRFFATGSNGPSVDKPKTYRNDLLKGQKFDHVDYEAALANKPDDGGLNIEAIAPRSDGSLLIGFRSPLTNNLTKGSAIVVPLTNPAEFLDRKAAPIFGDPIPLALGDRGIRDMISFNKQFLLIAGLVGDPPKDAGKGSTFALFLWDGTSSDTLRRVDANLLGLNPEALVDLGGGKVLVLSDEGDTQLPKYDGKKCKSKKVDPKDRSFAGRVISISA